MPDAVNPDRNSLVYVYPGDDGPADGDTIQFNATTGRWETRQGGASAPTYYVQAGMASNGGPEPTDCFAIVPLVDGAQTSATVVCPLQTVPSGVGNGYSVKFTYPVAPPTGSIDLHQVMFEVSNADGTEKLGLRKAWSSGTPIAVGDPWDLSPLVVFETVGSDLAVAADHLSIDSTAGGQFTAEVTYTVKYTAA